MTECAFPPDRESVRRTVRPLFALTCLGAVAWIAAIFLAPYLRSRAMATGASFLYALFAPVCHQIPGRSFTFCGFPLAVCARCLGIYSGFLAGLAVYPAARGFSRVAVPGIWLFLLFSVPIGFDFVGGVLGLWASPNALRFATGLVWGLLLPFYFLTGTAELLLWRAARRRRAGSGRGPDKGAPAARLPDSEQGLDCRGQINVK